MRNVVKGFEFSQMAVPKVHADNLNAGFSSYHTPRAPSMRMLRLAPKSPNPIARRPGKNVAIRGGYKV